MNFRRHKSFFVTSALVLFLVLAVVLISAFWPKYEERFIEVSLLGKDKTAKGYFLNDNCTLKTGSQVSWYIYLHNHMGSLQDVTVKVKLLNSTVDAPNDTEHKPSPFSSFVEFPLSLSVDDTILVPFSWSISETVTQNGSIIIKHLMINDQTVEVNVPAFSNSPFRIAFELWVYDQSSHEYKFGWESGNKFFSASLCMYFRVSLPADYID